jgi:hypothetical protein
MELPRRVPQEPHHGGRAPQQLLLVSEPDRFLPFVEIDREAHRLGRD